jgi:hypothetical protein
MQLQMTRAVHGCSVGSVVSGPSVQTLAAPNFLRISSLIDVQSREKEAPGLEQWAGRGGGGEGQE